MTEQTRIVNQIKAILTRFGIRTFRPKLRKAEEQLKQLRTAEGSPLPDNTRAELCRRLAGLRMVRDQIQAIEKARPRKLTANRAEPLCRLDPPPRSSPWMRMICIMVRSSEIDRI
ncbi:MAG: hypothetical protein JO283_19380 [Bradyrhizobium sp.]|nr:hypothetical protein [Bradyrhizobium sp.]